MWLKSIFFVYFFLKLSHAVDYDAYSGFELTADELAEYDNTRLEKCTVDITPCDESEGRRLDGSCNNLNYPSRGMAVSPPEWLVTPVHSTGSEPRKTVSGEDLPSAKAVREALLCSEEYSDDHFTQSLVSAGLSILADTGFYGDTLYSMRDTDVTDLKNLYRITSMNKTKPIFYQDYECTDDSILTPFGGVVPAFDLNLIYYPYNEENTNLRSYKNGELATEEENGMIWPPNGDGYCPNNAEDETRCFANYPAVHMPLTLWLVWFIRLHNHWCQRLLAVNPCWDDQTLYENARKINIAVAQVLYLEWLTALEGRENLIKAGILEEGTGFRDIYDPNTYPVASVDFLYIFRALFTVVDTNAKMYSTDGTLSGKVSMVDLVFRPGYLAVDDNMKGLTQGQFRQPCGKFDDCMDLNIATDDLDIAADDLERGRYLGIAPYIDYVQYCTGKNISSFSDLADLIDEENIEKLKTVYGNVADIELMAAHYVEKQDKVGYLSTVTACLLNDFFLKAIKSDRFWHEREEQFTYDQLQEIKKATLALFLCAVGDGVTEVQERAFELIDEDTNPLVSCSSYTYLDLTPWADSKCTETTTCDTDVVTSAVTSEDATDDSTDDSA